MNPNTWISFLTSVIGMAGAAAGTDGLISGKMSQTIASAATMLVPIVWGKFVHSDSKVVQTASVVHGVAEPIRISADAPAALQALAKDNSVPGVQPVSPYTAPTYPSATQRR